MNWSKLGSSALLCAVINVVGTAFLFTAFILQSTTALADSIPAIDFSNPSEDYQNEYPWTLGFEFRAWENFSIDALGFYDARADGFAESHPVGLWDEHGILIASTLVTTASYLEGFFRWEVIEPINLSAGSLYVIAGFTYRDDYTWNPNDYSQDGRFYLRGARYGYSTSLLFPEDTLPELIGLFGPNFRIVDPILNIPTPPGISLLIVGLLAAAPMRRRSCQISRLKLVSVSIFFSCCCSTAFALSVIPQPVQGPASWAGQIPLGARYQRYLHENVGIVAEYDNVFDSFGNYIIPVGEKLRWVWLRDDVQIGAFEYTYVGGEDRCWVNSAGVRSCGTYNKFLVFNRFRCRPETGSYTVILFRNGEDVIRHGFDTERFKMRVDGSTVRYPLELKPMEYEASGVGEKKRVTVKIVDDLGCNQALKDVEVVLQSFNGSENNHHTHFASGSKGTGKFVLVPGHDASLTIDDTKASGKTNGVGQLLIDYQAMNYALKEDVKIVFRRPPVSGQIEQTKDLTVSWAIKLGDYAPDPYGLDFAFTGACGRAHVGGGATFLRAEMWPLLKTGLEAFSAETGKRLTLNDGSFPWGGGVDTIGGACRIHKSHRMGIDIDINGTTVGGMPQDLRWEWVSLEEAWSPYDDTVILVPSFIPLGKILTEQMRLAGLRKINEEPWHYRM